ATLILGASLVVSELRTSLNLIWKVPTPASNSIFGDLLRTLQYRFWSFLMVLAAGLLLLISLVVNTVVAGLGKNLQNWIAPPPAVLQASNLLFWFLATTLLFALIYKILPDVSMEWNDVVVG